MGLIPRLIGVVLGFRSRGLGWLRADCPLAIFSRLEFDKNKLPEYRIFLMITLKFWLLAHFGEFSPVIYGEVFRSSSNFGLNLNLSRLKFGRNKLYEYMVFLMITS